MDDCSSISALACVFWPPSGRSSKNVSFGGVFIKLSNSYFFGCSVHLLGFLLLFKIYLFADLASVHHFMFSLWLAFICDSFK